MPNKELFVNKKKKSEEFKESCSFLQEICGGNLKWQDFLSYNVRGDLVMDRWLITRDGISNQEKEKNILSKEIIDDIINNIKQDSKYNIDIKINDRFALDKLSVYLIAYKAIYHKEGKTPENINEDYQNNCQSKMSFYYQLHKKLFDDLSKYLPSNSPQIKNLEQVRKKPELEIISLE